MNRALWLAVVPFVAVLSGCSGRSPRHAQQAAPPPPAPGTVAQAPASGPAAPLLEAGRQAVSVDQQQRAALVEQNLDLARKAMANADIDAARSYYGKVLDLDPQNAEAQQGWKSLNADRPSTVSDYFDQARREELIRRDEAAAQVSAYMKRGQTLAAQGDPEAAVREYGAALAIVGWYTDQTAFGVTTDSLRALIESTKQAAADAERDQRAQATRKAMADRERDLALERQERLGRIRAYFREADLAYRRGEYPTAREYARAVLREDPTNTGAKQMIDISYEAEHASRQDRNRKTFDEEWKRVTEEFDKALLPQVRTVQFPDNWLQDMANRKAKVVGDIEAPADTESKQAVIATLQAKRVKGLQFTDQNLDQVVTYLRTVTGLNFHITPKVRTGGKFDEVRVSIPGLDDVSVAQVLDLVTNPYQLKWDVRNGVVTIALAEEIAGEMRVRYIDVKDLAVKIQNFRGTDIFLAPSNYTPPEPPELPEPAPIYPTDGLSDTIKQVVDPDSWNDPATIDIKNGTLIVRNTQETLDKVEQLVEELRRNSGPMVSMEVRFITMEDNFLRDVGVDVRGLGDDSQGVGAPGLGPNRPMDDIFFGTAASPLGAGTGNDSGIYFDDGQDGAYSGRVENLFDSVLGTATTLLGTGGLSLQHTFLDDTAVEVILRAVQKSERLQQITASKLTVYNTQRATVEVLNKVAYVADYDVEIAQAANIANPVIRNVVDGVVLDVKPVVSANRRFITLELRPTVATLVRPIPTFSTSLASNIAAAPVVIQIPRLQKSQVRTTVTMPDGGTLLLGGLKFYEQVDAVSEIPILGQIPVLGFLFSRKGTYTARKNLIVLITANIEVLEEQEPSGQYTPPPTPEPFVPVTVPEDLPDFTAPMCPEPPACDPCAKRSACDPCRR